jgi:AhpC/TSA family
MGGPGIDAPVTLIVEGKAATARRAQVRGDDVWLPLDELLSATAWELKPQGVCRGETCVPLSPSQKAAVLGDEKTPTWFNFTEFAGLIEAPVAADPDERIWYFGPPGWEWKSRSAGNAAPDFTAPDLAGHQHSLRELRGKKMLLLFWASW